MLKTKPEPASVAQRNYVLALIEDRRTDHLTASQLVDIIFLKYTAVEKMRYCPATKSDVSELITALLAAPRTYKPTTFHSTTLNYQLNGLPTSRYAVRRVSDPTVIDFYQVAQLDSGQKVLYRLHGAPGQWRRRRVNFTEFTQVINALSVNPLAAAQLYGAEFTTCARCESPLSNPQSVARQMGPVCIKWFQ